MGIKTRLSAVIKPTPLQLKEISEVKDEFILAVRPLTVGDECFEVDLCDKMSGDIEYGDGATIDLSELPAGTTAIRVYQS